MMFKSQRQDQGARDLGNDTGCSGYTAREVYGQWACFQTPEGGENTAGLSSNTTYVWRRRLSTNKRGIGDSPPPFPELSRRGRRITQLVARQTARAGRRLPSSAASARGRTLTTASRRAHARALPGSAN